ncbi:hypothetical protein EDB89DRAFT_2240400 [Lactarius sanguifluus]|nr:hypothetical protein EDB89DRAFT_2240400 [Lactarius sanguifluus]
MTQPVQPGSDSQPDSHIDDQLADIADQVPNLPVTDMDNTIAQQAQQQQQQVIDHLDAMRAGIDNLRAAANNLLEAVNNLQAQVGALQAGVDALQAGVGALARAGSAQWIWCRVDKLGIIIILDRQARHVQAEEMESSTNERSDRTTPSNSLESVWLAVWSQAGGEIVACSTSQMYDLRSFTCLRREKQHDVAKKTSIRRRTPSRRVERRDSGGISEASEWKQGRDDIMPSNVHAQVTA